MFFVLMTFVVSTEIRPGPEAAGVPGAAVVMVIQHT